MALNVSAVMPSFPAAMGDIAENILVAATSHPVAPLDRHPLGTARSLNE
jgi:hypothetical protein